jgi:hypothetical protein
MRALLAGLVVVCACEVPANTNEEPSAAAGPAAPTRAPRVVLPPVTPGDICEQYVRTLERIARCPKFPPDSAKALRGQIPTLRKMYAQYGSQKQVQDSCQMAIDMTEKAYKPIGC